jgi:hypothetical protein
MIESRPFSSLGVNVSVPYLLSNDGTWVEVDLDTFLRVREGDSYTSSDWKKTGTR